MAAVPVATVDSDVDGTATAAEEGMAAGAGPLLLVAILNVAPGTNSAADREGTNGAALLVSERERGTVEVGGDEAAAAVLLAMAERKEGTAEGNADGAPIAAAPSRLSRLDGGGEWCSGGVRCACDNGVLGALPFWPRSTIATWLCGDDMALRVDGAATAAAPTVRIGLCFMALRIEAGGLDADDHEDTAAGRSGGAAATGAVDANAGDCAVTVGFEAASAGKSTSSTTSGMVSVGLYSAVAYFAMWCHTPASGDEKVDKSPTMYSRCCAREHATLTRRLKKKTSNNTRSQGNGRTQTNAHG